MVTAIASLLQEPLRDGSCLLISGSSTAALVGGPTAAV